jgi:hypothetical protein
MTTGFIIIIFSVIVIYDIIVAVTKRETITAVFRKWYSSKPIVPYMVGVVFIGHFQQLVPVKGIPFFITFSAVYMLWCIIMSGTNINWSRKFYNLNCKYFYIPMAIGTIVGSFWRG